MRFIIFFQSLRFWLCLAGSSRLHPGRPFNTTAVLVALIASAIFTLTDVGAVEIAPTTNLRAHYSWMLPKTVLDTTISYTLEDCKDDASLGAQLTVKIAAPSIVPQYIPDTSVGLRSLDPALLKSFWQDSTITVLTFPDTNILQSLASNPVNQVATIVGNVITGITKLVAAASGVSPASAPSTPKPVSKCGTAKDDIKTLADMQDALKAAQKRLADPNITDAQATEINKKIANLQVGIGILQNALTLTFKRTIDPGVTAIMLADDPDTWVSQKPFPIGPEGLIARFSPFQSLKKLKKANWFDDVDLASKENNSQLHVNVYLEFANANPRVARCRHCSVYPTRVPKNFQFREAVLIPVSVYQGDDKNRLAPIDKQDRSLLPLPLKPTVFAQFGRAQTLPLTAKIFENLKWQVTFATSGQVTSANFESKSIGAQITTLFSSAAGGTASIATELRNAANAPSSETQRLLNENAALTAEINNIDLNQKLQGLIAKGATPPPR
jgi:hypothetical protein